MVEWLLGQGADVNLRTSESSPLFGACLADDADMARLLLDKGAVVNEVCHGVWTPLHAAYQSGAVTRLLLDQGANVNTTNSAGWTPLHKAIDKDKLDIARFLLKRGANVNLVARSTDAPLHLACSKGSPAQVRLLLDA
ncbi:hypothetical protein COCVIDRAFT_56660, partial [Bipolaris victoriae FI3]